MMKSVVVLLVSASLLSLLGIDVAFANGVGENTPWQFRSASDKQVLLNEAQRGCNLTVGLG